MPVSHRRTVVVQGRLAMRSWRLRAARERIVGLHILGIEQLAARLAGGFLKPVDDESLRIAVQAALPVADLGELERIKNLPGMVDAASESLRKAWRAGIDLQARASRHPRLASMAAMETAVLERLPAGMKAPADLAGAAMERIGLAGALFGPIEFDGLDDVAPCWRPLILALTARTPVSWAAGVRAVPSWVPPDAIAVSTSAAAQPALRVVSASTAYHEAIEAMRWARELLASGRAQPDQIGIAAVSPGEYDDHFLALRSDANFDLHFVHGVKVTATWEGQAAAALADILLRGLSQSRMRRLASFAAAAGPALEGLPPGWMRIAPSDAPLTSLAAWSRLLDLVPLEAWPDEADHRGTVRALVTLLDQGVALAAEIGDAVLTCRALAIWRKALLTGPAASIDATLENLRLDEDSEACTSAAWMPASELAAAPRRFVRLLGLNSSHWPRGISEDRLLSEHIVPAEELDPTPIAVADRRCFQTILASTADEVVCSRSRRDGEGRIMGRSALLHGLPEETYLRRNAVPRHAFSETDRQLARPAEFRQSAQATSAIKCWRDWQSPELTAHDGLVRANHPALQAVLAQSQSAKSLRQLLRNPLGFVWQYGLRLRKPVTGAEPIMLDALSMGNLVHLVLDLALRDLESSGGLAGSPPDRVVEAVDRATASAAARWEAEQGIPPGIIWNQTLAGVRLLATRALAWGDAMAGAKAYGEVPFGGMPPRNDAVLPWDAAAAVDIPGTGFRISGYIDRLDISADGRRAFVRDYKTGRPLGAEVRLDGGKELQRCLYAFAVKARLGDDVEVVASLLYPRDQVELALDQPDTALEEISLYLRHARESLLAGVAVIGADAADPYNDLAFALPANARAAYLRRKIDLATTAIGAVAAVWSAN